MLNDIVECQALDWKIHKMLCSSINDAKPGPEYRRVLLFPEQGEQPRFEWMKVTEVPSETEGFEDWDRDQFFGDTIVERYPILRNHIQARNTFEDDHDGIHVWVDGQGINTPRNQAVRAVTRGLTCSHNWRGPILATRKAGRDPSVKWYVDIDSRDFRSIADFFTAAWRQDGHDNSEKRALACMMPCSSMVSKGATEYCQVVIDQANSIYSREGSAIANLLGTPLLIAGGMKQYDMASNGVTVESRNPAAEMLKRDVNSTTVGYQRSPEEDEDRQAMLDTFGAQLLELSDFQKATFGTNGFGTSPAWCTEAPVGPIMIARADGKPLTGAHLRAICKYMKKKIEPLLQKAIRGLADGTLVVDRERVLNSVTKADFLEFWNTHTATHDAEDYRWLTMPSPYDLQGTALENASRVMERLWVEQGRPTTAKTRDGLRAQGRESA